LASNPIIRDLRGTADKTISNALKSLDGWQPIGYVHRLGSKRRWYSRFDGEDPRSQQEFVSVDEFPVEGSLEMTAMIPDVDDLLS